MSEPESSLEERAPRYRTAAFAGALTIASALFLVGPAAVYYGNVAGFELAFSTLALRLVIPAAITVTGLTAVALILPPKLRSYYAPIVFMTGFGLWFQAHVLVWDYGVLDGQTIDWRGGAWRGFVDAAFWISLIAVALLLQRKVVAQVPFLATMLLSIHLIYVAYLVVVTPVEPREPPVVSEPSDEIFEFSARENVIHIIFDGFQSRVLSTLLDEQPERYRQKLAGFTFFTDNAGSFPTTFMSVPLIFSSKTYTNHMPANKFLKEVFAGETIPNLLHDSGYQTDMIVQWKRTADGRTTHHHNLSRLGGSGPQENNGAALLMDLVLFRSVPHFLKDDIVNGQQWRIQPLFAEDELVVYPYFRHRFFFDELLARMTASREYPVYKFIHSMMTHPPFVVDDTCEYAREDRSQRLVQARCSLEIFVSFLDRLRELGIYDSSFIILNADHGQGSNDDGIGRQIAHAEAVLLVKPPFSPNEPLRRSSAPTALLDIPATIASVLDLEANFVDGRSVFEISEDAERRRYFYHYSWGKKSGHTFGTRYFDRLLRYTIDGPLFDRRSWRRDAVYPSPQELDAYLPAEFDPAKQQDKGRFFRTGWSWRGDGAVQPESSLFVYLPAGEDVCMTARVKVPEQIRGQQVTVTVDGEERGRWRLGSGVWEERHLLLRRVPGKPPRHVSVLTFASSEHLTLDNRKVAAWFEWLRFSRSVDACEEGDG